MNNNLIGIIGAIGGVLTVWLRFKHNNNQDKIAQQKQDDDHDRLISELQDKALATIQSQIDIYKKQLEDLTTKAKEESEEKDQRIKELAKENAHLKRQNQAYFKKYGKLEEI